MKFEILVAWYLYILLFYQFYLYYATMLSLML